MWTQFGLHHVHQFCTLQDRFQRTQFLPSPKNELFWATPNLIVFKKESTSRGSPKHLAESKSQEIAPFPSNPPRGLPFLPNIWMSSVQNQDKWAKARRSNPKSAHIVTTGAEGAGKDVLPQKLLRRSLFIYELSLLLQNSRIASFIWIVLTIPYQQDISTCVT